MGTLAGTQAREARSASLALPRLAGSRRSLLLSSVDLRSFLCWNLNPVSGTGAEPESCGEGEMPWRLPCYSAVRVWELTQPWKADQAAGTMTSSGTIWGHLATPMWMVVVQESVFSTEGVPACSVLPGRRGTSGQPTFEVLAVYSQALPVHFQSIISKTHQLCCELDIF